MQFEKLIPLIFGKTDIDVVWKGSILIKMRHDRLDETPNYIKKAEVDYITAVDRRTIEIGIKNIEGEGVTY